MLLFKVVLKGELIIESIARAQNYTKDIYGQYFKLAESRGK